MLEICNSAKHDTIVYETRLCPACLDYDTIEELKDKCNYLDDIIAGLKTEIDELKGKTQGFGGNTND